MKHRELCALALALALLVGLGCPVLAIENLPQTALETVAASETEPTEAAQVANPEYTERADLALGVFAGLVFFAGTLSGLLVDVILFNRIRTV